MSRRSGTMSGVGVMERVWSGERSRKSILPDVKNKLSIISNDVIVGIT